MKKGFFVKVFSFTPQKKEIKEMEILKVSVDQETGEQFATAKVNGQEMKLDEFDVNNSSPRKVVCISGGYGCVKGRIYNVVSINVGACRTNLSLKETDCSSHNSVDFAEMPEL